MGQKLRRIATILWIAAALISLTAAVVTCVTALGVPALHSTAVSMLIYLGSAAVVSLAMVLKNIARLPVAFLLTLMSFAVGRVVSEMLYHL